MAEHSHTTGLALGTELTNASNRGGGGVNPSAEEELVVQPGCTDAVSTFEFAGMFRVLIYLGMGQIFFKCS